MPDYDSDSSDDNNDAYTTTNVVLGYAVDEPAGDDISHIGGHPVKCKVCNDYMSLLLQLNADLAQYFPGDQRRLQVWYCRRKTCARKIGSIRVLREVKLGKGSGSGKDRAKDEKKKTVPTSASTQSQAQESTLGLGNALFGGTSSSTISNGNVNPFSTSTTSSSAAANPFSGLAATSTLAAMVPQRPVAETEPLSESFAEKLKLSWPSDDAFPTPYPMFYLDAYPEELDPQPEAVAGEVGESSKTNYEMDDSTMAALDKEIFESSLDKTFQKFSDIVAQNPEQVLRYEFKGQPLLYSGSDGVAARFFVPHGKAGAVKGMPSCEKCGSQRVFEMQLTPYLIYEIEKDEALDIDNGMEWGTIVVGTCGKNCGEEATVVFREEWVGVQWEERVTGR
ncbi:hypothetical protein Dsin_032538 [Dipteronia sinensis]|uniref:Programmed cell death protein 2 C-terminal domain-containing protein n=1 Tax=Dipteronia sinensis TaxID=43782 RepID=A0AAD9ZHQ9_9ROSI|nr:hypothetical protein Dsin_032538 [Dipteronia sinensis]